MLDYKKVGETLIDVHPGLPETDNFQHWPPWRPLVVETARHILDYTGGTLIMPMTVLIEAYWREISDGFAAYDIPVRHFLLHTDTETLHEPIMGNTVTGPSGFRLAYLVPSDKAFRGWLGVEADVIDTTALTPSEVGTFIADAIGVP